MDGSERNSSQSMVMSKARLRHPPSRQKQDRKKKKMIGVVWPIWGGAALLAL
jgi:hypothetical protein